MPLLTSDRDGARTLDLTPQSRGRYLLSHGDYCILNTIYEKLCRNNKTYMNLCSETAHVKNIFHLSDKVRGLQKQHLRGTIFWLSSPRTLFSLCIIIREMYFNLEAGPEDRSSVSSASPPYVTLLSYHSIPLLPPVNIVTIGGYTPLPFLFSRK
ncbi:hypothetical protein SK128_011474 [Halocaridina rubra]|uniref:Uncharacterized protein n=1 Tax=Halocaridina rubra TaxID=373956 RepID=A0AAN8XN50_HALRR